MSKDNPEISRENQVHAKEALADKIRSGTITKIDLLKEKLWR